MADYYPLIARAISGLDPSAPSESRRALYERARTALISQLRGVQPALSEAEITRERLALEDAVRRVEADAARRAAALQAEDPQRERAAPPPPNPSASPRAPLPGRRDGPRPGDALRESARTARTGNVPPPAPGRAPVRPDANGTGEPRAPRNLRGDQPPPLTRTPPPVQQGLPTSMRDVRRAISAATTRGCWTISPRPPVPSAVRRKDRVCAMWLPTPMTLAARPVQPGAARRRTSRISAARRPTATMNPSRKPDAISRTTGRAPALRRATNRKPRGAASLKTAIWVCVAVIAIGGAVWGGPKAYSLIKSLTTKPVQQQAETPPKDASGTRPKITDRVGQPGSQQIAPVAQRVVLYDEDPSAPQGKQYVGSVIWRTERSRCRLASRPISACARTSIFPSARSRCRFRSAATPMRRCPRVIPPN
jgi:hypothetical protein